MDFYREKLIIGSTIYMKIILVSVSVFEQLPEPFLISLSTVCSILPLVEIHTDDVVLFTQLGN